MLKILKPDFKHLDERGSLIQLVHDGFRQVNVIHSTKDSQRGGHYHKVNQEAFFVISGHLFLNLSFHEKREHYEFRAGDMFLIEPYVFHEFIFPEDTLLVSMYDQGVELPKGEMDIYTQYNFHDYGKSKLKENLLELIHNSSSFTDYHYIEWKYNMLKYLTDCGENNLIEKIDDILAEEVVINVSKLSEEEPARHFKDKMQVIYKLLFDSENDCKINGTQNE